MSINMSSSILEQMQSQTRQINGASSLNPFASAKTTENHPSFSDILFNSVNSISQMQNHAKTQAEGYLSGVEGIGLNDVMVSMQESSLALNIGVQARNKLVNAYQEIMNMPV